MDDLARHAARSARILLGQPAWSEQDWEDMLQEAHIALWTAPAGHGAGWRFIRARYAVMTAYVRCLVAHNPATTVPLSFAEQLEIVEDETIQLHPEIAVALANLFLADRKQRQGRAVAAALRQVQIVDLLVQGYRNDAIALALDMTVNDVKSARAHIKASLAAEAQRRGLLDAAALQAITSTRTQASYDRRVARRRYRRLQ